MGMGDDPSRRKRSVVCGGNVHASENETIGAICSNLLATLISIHVRRNVTLNAQRKTYAHCTPNKFRKFLFFKVVFFVSFVDSCIKGMLAFCQETVPYNTILVMDN